MRACKACADAKVRCDGATKPCVRCRQKDYVCHLPVTAPSQQLMPTNTTVVSCDDDLVATSPKDCRVAHDTYESVRDTPPELDASFAASLSNGLGQDHFALDDAPPGSAQQRGLQTRASIHFDRNPSSYFHPHGDPSDANPSPPTQHTIQGQLHTPMQTDHGHPRPEDQPFMDSLPLDVLDFGADAAFDFTTSHLLSLPFDDQSMPYNFNFAPGDDTSFPAFQIPSRAQTPHDRRHTTLDMGAQAFRESIWLWIPTERDHGAAELHALDRFALPREESRVQNIERGDARMCHGRIDEATRSEMLAMVLSTADRAVHRHMIVSFPGADLLTGLVNDFLVFHAQQDITWIHSSSITLNKESPVFLTCLVAHGAILSPNQDLRKLGYAMQEAVRIAGRDEVRRS